MFPIDYLRNWNRWIMGLKPQLHSRKISTFVCLSSGGRRAGPHKKVPREHDGRWSPELKICLLSSGCHLSLVSLWAGVWGLSKPVFSHQQGQISTDAPYTMLQPSLHNKSGTPNYEVPSQYLHRRIYMCMCVPTYKHFSGLAILRTLAEHKASISVNREACLFLNLNLFFYKA